MFASRGQKGMILAFCYGLFPGGLGLGTLWFLTFLGPGGGGGGGGCLHIFLPLKLKPLFLIRWLQLRLEIS